jgi:2-keto-4-pentenoate hydratase
MNSWQLDDRIVRGMSALELKLRTDLKNGAHQVGWKLAFGSPTGLTNLKIEKPLVGYLLDSKQISNGETINISTWSKPIGEAEIAIYFGNDVPHSASLDEVMDCISALGPAIEVADLFQRHYILGERDESRAGGNIEGLRAIVAMPDGTHTTVEDVQALTGKIPIILQHFSEVVESFSGGVKAGQFLIIGSIVPPIAISAGESFSYSLGHYPILSVHFAT